MDEKYMFRALELANKARGFTSPNPLVGAVIVKNDRIIGEGYHKKRGENHAEINAFDSAKESVEGATLYVNLEPCSHYGKTPPCADKIIEKKIKRVVVAMTDPNPKVAGRGIEKLKAAGIQVDVGILKEQAALLNEVFIKYITKNVPFVHLKAGMSLDGKIATRSGQSRWITGGESRKEVHQLRAYYSGIMAGIQTVIDDDPELTCRDYEGSNPVRIVVDTKLRIPLDSKVLLNQENAPTIIATTESADKEKLARLETMGVKILTIPEYEGHVCLKSLMQELGNMEIDSILLEGGATLNYSSLKENIVDKVSIYIAPMLIGGQLAPSPVGGEGVLHLSDAVKLTNINYSQVGKDIKIEGYIGGGECLPVL
jgi:diaminohydroxyphosphoribosylaminopyrimidine deaminase/5-amino-6-(5-phosphoribosylamino)uracil reductase